MTALEENDGAASGLTAGETPEFREALAKEIAAENMLVGNRMTWNLTFQGFLFTGYALALGRGTVVAEGEIMVPDTALLVSKFLKTLPYAGVAAASVALVGILAAFWQMKVLQRRWTKNLEKWGPKPFSSTAGDLAGAFPPFAINLIVIATWCSLL